MLPGETVASGAPFECKDCYQRISGPKVMHSNAGYYIGYDCKCGPYSRETEYYQQLEDAEDDLREARFLERST